MKNFKGTKGEWIISEWHLDIITTENTNICQIFKKDKIECQANANLIASSPELLKELIEMHNNSNAKTPLERERFYRVEKLINKAIGQ